MPGAVVREVQRLVDKGIEVDRLPLAGASARVLQHAPHDAICAVPVFVDLLQVAESVRSDRRSRPAWASSSIAKPGAAVSFSSSRRSTERLAKLLTKFSGFLISCAMPAVSWPSEAIFSAWIRLAWVAFSSSMLVVAVPACAQPPCARVRIGLLQLPSHGVELVRQRFHSSPVRTSMRLSRSPAPMRAAPAASRWIGPTMRRTTNKPRAPQVQDRQAARPLSASPTRGAARVLRFSAVPRTPASRAPAGWHARSAPVAHHRSFPRPRRRGRRAPPISRNPAAT